MTPNDIDRQAIAETRHMVGEILDTLKGTLDGRPGLLSTVQDHGRRIAQIEATRQQARRSALTVAERVAAWGVTGVLGWVVYQLCKMRGTL